jgi:hypothetical protein
MVMDALLYTRNDNGSTIEKPDLDIIVSDERYVLESNVLKSILLLVTDAIS